MMSAPKRVVEYVNRLRADLGAEPLEDLTPGKQWSNTRCPVAVSLAHGASVTRGWIRTWGTDENPDRVLDVIPPRYVANFIRDFDAGKYPELIA